MKTGYQAGAKNLRRRERQRARIELSLHWSVTGCRDSRFPVADRFAAMHEGRRSADSSPSRPMPIDRRSQHVEPNSGNAYGRSIKPPTIAAGIASPSP